MILKTISLSQALPSDNGFDLKYEGKKKTHKNNRSLSVLLFKPFLMENAVQVLLSPPPKIAF